MTPMPLAAFAPRRESTYRDALLRASGMCAEAGKVRDCVVHTVRTQQTCARSLSSRCAYCNSAARSSVAWRAVAFAVCTCSSATNRAVCAACRAVWAASSNADRCSSHAALSLRCNYDATHARDVCILHHEYRWTHCGAAPSELPALLHGAARLSAGPEDVPAVSALSRH